MEPPNSSLPDRVWQCKDAASIDCVTVGDDINKRIVARSYHPGGVLATLADGSVHFYSDTIDLVTWKALATRAGGEVVSME